MTIRQRLRYITDGLEQQSDTVCMLSLRPESFEACQEGSDMNGLLTDLERAVTYVRDLIDLLEETCYAN